jgi:hypothetical protein
VKERVRVAHGHGQGVTSDKQPKKSKQGTTPFQKKKCKWQYTFPFFPKKKSFFLGKVFFCGWHPQELQTGA